MPGAICGMWGVCGAVTSMGAALSVIDGTGPLSADNSWGKHMEFTSNALKSLSQVGGPRCCKRDVFLSFQEAIKYINENYDVELQNDKFECFFSEKNEQCIKSGCPFIGRGFDDNWGLEDPTGKSDEEFKKVIQMIERRVLELKEFIQ